MLDCTLYVLCLCSSLLEHVSTSGYCSQLMMSWRRLTSPSSSSWWWTDVMIDWVIAGPWTQWTLARGGGGGRQCAGPLSQTLESLLLRAVGWADRPEDVWRTLEKDSDRFVLLYVRCFFSLYMFLSYQHGVTFVHALGVRLWAWHSSCLFARCRCGALLLLLYRNVLINN